MRLLYVHRPVARKLLATAEEHEDVDDIRALFKANAGRMDIAELRQYFQLFDQEDLLDELIAENSGN